MAVKPSASHLGLLKQSEPFLKRQRIHLLACRDRDNKQFGNLLLTIPEIYWAKHGSEKVM